MCKSMIGNEFYRGSAGSGVVLKLRIQDLINVATDVGDQTITH
jgi:hypothetical protein